MSDLGQRVWVDGAKEAASLGRAVQERQPDQLCYSPSWHHLGA